MEYDVWPLPAIISAGWLPAMLLHVSDFWLILDPSTSHYQYG